VTRASSQPTTLMRAGWTAQVAALAIAQRRFPFRSAQSIARAQSRRVRQAVTYAYQHVPYYRETMRRLGLAPDGFRTAQDLARLPLIDRRQVQADPEYFVSRAQSLGSYLEMRSGGSTGRPITVFVDRHSAFLGVAYGERFRSLIQRLTGRLRYRQALILAGSSIGGEVHDTKRQISLVPSRLLVVRERFPLSATLADNVASLARFDPDVIACAGSYLEVLFPHLKSTQTRFPRTKVVVYSSDHLSEPARRLIAEQFGIQVLSWYTAMEGSEIGFECEEHRGLHVHSDLCPVRIVDPEGRDVAEGESGEVVTSSLLNRATVLLNYRLGDIAGPLPGVCPCGRNLPMISLLEGRVEEWLVTTTGDQINSRAVRLLLRDEPDLWQYQLVQEAPDKLTVKLIAAEDCDREGLKQRVAGKLTDLFGPATAVQVSFAATLPRTPRGKVQPVVSLIGDRR
jgi:phenylacetate-CoA ligase